MAPGAGISISNAEVLHHAVLDPLRTHRITSTYGSSLGSTLNACIVRNIQIIGLLNQARETNPPKNQTQNN